VGKALVASSNAAAIATGTNYLIGGANSAVDANATEAIHQIPIRVAGTFSYLQVLADNVGTARSVKFRKGGVTGALTVSPTDTTAGLYVDSTHSDTVAAGNLIALQSIATGTPLYSVVAMIFSATSGHSSLFACNTQAANFSAASVSTFSGIAGQATSATNATESQQQAKVRAPGTVGNFFAYVSTNARANTTTVNFRINSVNGTNVLSIATLLTGLFEDTAHSDTLNTGDLINSQVTTGTGVANFNVETIGIGITSSGGAVNDLFGVRQAGQARAAAAAQTFYPIVGRFAAAASEANAKIRHGFPVTLSKARISLSANTYTGTCTFLTRINGANGVQSVPIATTLTGYFEDATNSETVGATDDVCFAIQDGTANSITIRATGLTETEQLYSTNDSWDAPPRLMRAVGY
jgi:hypothetical protein